LAKIYGVMPRKPFLTKSVKTRSDYVGDDWYDSGNALISLAREVIVSDDFEPEETGVLSPDGKMIYTIYEKEPVGFHNFS